MKRTNKARHTKHQGNKREGEKESIRVFEYRFTGQNQRAETRMAAKIVKGRYDKAV